MEKEIYKNNRIEIMREVNRKRLEEHNLKKSKAKQVILEQEQKIAALENRLLENLCTIGFHEVVSRLNAEYHKLAVMQGAYKHRADEQHGISEYSIIKQ